MVIQLSTGEGMLFIKNMSIKIVKATQNLSGVLKIWENRHQIDITIRIGKILKDWSNKWKMTMNAKF